MSKLNLIDVVSMGWTTVIDLKNKLVIHVSMNVTEANVDEKLKDPDGIPLVWVGGKPITRVRRMTEEEYVKYVKEFGLNFEVDCRIWTTMEKVGEE